jgi:hypothetical protein
MTRTLSAAILAMVLLLVATPSPSAECKLLQFASVDLVLPPGGPALVPVKIGERQALMQLNMASGLATVSPAAVTQLGLRTGPVRTDVKLTGVGGQPIEREVRIDSLLIGGANFAGWKVYVQPGGAATVPMYQGQPVIGNLSSNFMNAVDMELDLARGKMNLFQHARCKGGQVYWSSDYATEYLYVDPSGLLYFPVGLDGKRIEASLNTQGPRSRLSEVIARSYFDFRRDAGVVVPRPAQGALGQAVGRRTMKLDSRKVSLANLEVEVVDDTQRNCEHARSVRASNAISFRNCFGIVPFVIGTDLLRQLRIYIASKEERIYFTQNAANAAPAAGGAASAGAGQGAAPAGDGAVDPASPVGPAAPPAAPEAR